MNFPPYWSRGSHEGFSCWRWSERSAEEARERAIQAARSLAERFRQGQRPEHGYGYPDRPLREPVLREFLDGSGERTAVVTRNSYGCLVLNTARLMFVDVDRTEEPPGPSLGGIFRRLLRREESRPATGDPESQLLNLAHRWAATHPGWNWRAYRTRAGWRLMATHAPMDPEGGTAAEVFEHFGADPLYQRLCKTQGCYRARLTPKPWRCGVSKPTARWPFENAAAEARFHNWENHYLKSAGDFATCRILEEFGTGRIDPALQPLVSHHDTITRADAYEDLA